MTVLAANLGLLELGQKVRTAFGLGVIAAVSQIDSLVYVTFSNSRGLYVFRPEQLELAEKQQQCDEH